ncbi:prephenate dehydrogenase/arogenate dehydrogenase family protein [Ectothiorhodospiraceae bacterium 2226]|nr:prephenate dehydrogenase/arogenate dehydrogenase family protein [Ectothiorhodospiraceae bacterium 2226]
MCQRLCIVGVGLIGGSLALALRRAGGVGEIVGCGRNAEQLALAQSLGVIDRYDTDPARAAAGADMVVLAVPVLAMEAVLGELAAGLGADTVLTDVGSTKGNVAAAAARSLGKRLGRFVPGHPIAGTERSGVQHAFPELYAGRRVILTPLEQTDPAATARVRALWEAAGAQVSEMGVAEHDAVLAATSHLPHLLAYALVDTLARMDERQAIFRYAAGGFRDFTRIASSDPQMWHDICLANREALLEVLGQFQGDLQRLEAALRAGDGEVLMEVFGRAKRARDAFVDSNGAAAPPQAAAPAAQDERE